MVLCYIDCNGNICVSLLCFFDIISIFEDYKLIYVDGNLVWFNLFVGQLMCSCYNCDLVLLVVMNFYDCSSCFIGLLVVELKVVIFFDFYKCIINFEVIVLLCIDSGLMMLCLFFEECWFSVSLVDVKSMVCICVGVEEGLFEEILYLIGELLLFFYKCLDKWLLVVVYVWCMEDVFLLWCSCIENCILLIIGILGFIFIVFIVFLVYYCYQCCLDYVLLSSEYCYCKFYEEGSDFIVLIFLELCYFDCNVVVLCFFGVLDKDCIIGCKVGLFFCYKVCQFDQLDIDELVGWVFVG